MGCGPPPQSWSDCTTVTSSLRLAIPCFPRTPSGPPGHLPRFAEKEVRARNGPIVTAPPLGSSASPGLNSALLPLMLWLSPAFPVGSFAYSQGLEWAVENGDVQQHALASAAGWSTS